MKFAFLVGPTRRPTPPTARNQVVVLMVNADREDSASPPATEVDRYEWRGERAASTAVIEAVAAATAQDQNSLPPLYDAIDGEALNTLLEGARDREAGRTRVVFDWAGVTVVIESAGDIEVWQDSED